MNEHAASIEVEGLVKRYKKGPRAVDGIDLHVGPGEIYGFLGPNGAGKSTTVHMLTTLLPPTSGSARVAGWEVGTDGPRVREQIGAALQEAALDPFLTAREHMRLKTALHGLAKSDGRRRSEELLERVGLSDAADRKARARRHEPGRTHADRGDGAPLCRAHPTPALAGRALADLPAVNPITPVLEALRSFISGTRPDAGLAFLAAAGMLVVFGAWAVRGMRSAEASGG